MRKDQSQTKRVKVLTLEGPETIEQCLNDLEIVYNKYDEPIGVRTNLY